MLHPAYDKMIQFASAGALGSELALAREEFIKRTGDLFESDETYERRLAAFLEWYVLDRPVSTGTHQTPAKLYIDSVAGDLTTPEIADLRQLTRTVLSLFEFKGVKGDKLRLVDLLSNEKIEVFERRRPAGVEGGDILEGRLVPHDDTYMLSDSMTFHPRLARKTIIRAAKSFRNSEARDGRIDLVHRVAYLANRCDRYAHIDPKEIFSELAS